MNKESKSHVPITPAHLEAFAGAVKSVLTAPLPAPAGASRGTPTQPGLADVLFNLGGGDFPTGATANHLSLAVRDGMRVGLHVAAQYERTSGLVELQLRNDTGKLGAEEARYRALTATASAVTVYVAARYVLWQLAHHRPEEVQAVTVREIAHPTITFAGRHAALQDLAHHLARVAGESDSELYAARAFADTLTEVVSDIVARSSSLEATAPFDGAAYQLQGTDFVIEGFEVSGPVGITSAEFRKVDFDDIVGNKAAKHDSRRMAYRLALFDLELKRNPFAELGAFPFVRMFFGPPGTGKSMQIAAMATLLQELCARRGVPFVYAPMPNTVISTFQGGSAERAEAWIRQHRNPNSINYLVIDDGESNLEDRTRQGVSAGVREVIGVFLRETEGAGAILLGNAVIEIFTNLPEQLDPAVLSRVRERTEQLGAQGFEDIADQLHLWWRKMSDVFPKELSGLDVLDGYQLMAAQRVGATLAATAGPYGDPRHEKTKQAFAAALKATKDPRALVPRAFAEFQKLVPGFTSRDIRNVSDTVSVRFMDFDIPETWFDNPAEFFDRPFDERVGVLRELSRASCQGLSFYEVLREEATRYLDVRALISDKQFERDVQEQLKRLQVFEEAERRHRASRG